MKSWVIIGIIIGVSAVLAYVAVSALSQYYYYYNNYYRYYGNGYVGAGMPMMWWGEGPLPSGQGYYSGVYGYGFSISTYPINASLTMVMTIPSYAHVHPQNNTIVFTSRDIDLTVIAMMDDDAERMFDATPPPYVHGDVFVIYGLINPTLVIPAGAVVHVTFINLDDDMYHNFVITRAPPPYPYYVMPYMAMSGGMGPQMMLNMEWLPPANYGAGYAYGYEYTFTITEPGTYWYLCTYPGHAESGMYGEIIVRG